MLSGNKAFFDADWSPLNNSIVTASADRHVRIYDPRSTGKYSDYLNYFYLEYILVNIKKKNIFLYPNTICITESIVKTTFTSHTGWVQSVRWSTTRDTLFLSAGYDGQVKLWETRRLVFILRNCFYTISWIKAFRQNSKVTATQDNRICLSLIDRGRDNQKEDILPFYRSSSLNLTLPIPPLV